MYQFADASQGQYQNKGVAFGSRDLFLQKHKVLISRNLGRDGKLRLRH